MANDEVLGPRKTMFVLVIVVGCFAVLWPRILSPLILGHTREQLKPNQFDREADVKQERPPIRAGPHPALRERGRAIPPGTPPPSKPIALPPHVRVRSPLSVYYELDIKPPPIPGMRPPLGSPGGPVAAPKSSMGFVMPIYTICIIVFFVYTLSKILFKRTGTPYEPMAPDPQFRRRVFRDDSRTTPDKFGHKETETKDAELEALRARLAETERAMQRIVGQLAQRDAEALDSTRPYTNGSIILNSGPVQIVTNEYQEPKENTPEPIKVKEPSPEIEKFIAETINTVEKETEIEHHEVSIVPNSITKEDLEEKEISYDKADINSELVKADIDYELIKADINSELVKEDIDSELIKEENIEDIVESKEETNDNTEYVSPVSLVNEEVNVPENTEIKENEENEIKDIKNKSDARLSEEFIHEERKMLDKTEEPIQEFTHEIVEETIKEDSPVEEEKIEDEKESSSVKVVGMELTADGSEWPRVQAQPSTPPQRPHEAEEVKAIYLETEIPQQSRVLIADFAEDRAESPVPAKNAPLVVSGKITLSLIQNAPRETPDRDVESTVDDFTTASGFTQPAEKQDDLSDEDIEEVEEIEEIEVEEIEEEVEEEEIEEVVENEEE